MNPRSWILVAGAICGALVVSLVFILVPEGGWTALNGVALGEFIFALLLSFLLPAQAAGSVGTKEAAALGATAVALLLLIAWTTLGCLVAFSGGTTSAKVMNVLSGGFILLVFVLNGFSRSAAGAIEAAGAVRSDHARWGRTLKEIASQCQDSGLRARLTQEGDNARYLSRDSNDVGLEANARSNSCLASLSTAVSRQDAAQGQAELARLKTLFAERERDLLAQRSKV